VGEVESTPARHPRKKTCLNQFYQTLLWSIRVYIRWGNVTFGPN